MIVKFFNGGKEILQKYLPVINFSEISTIIINKQVYKVNRIEYNTDLEELHIILRR